MESYNANSRNVRIDIVRGIAILCIIIGHMGVMKINRVVFTFHVPIFFLITGYFFSSKGTIGDFINKRIKTLIIPYAFTCIIMVCVAVVKELTMGDASNVMYVVKKWLYASIYGAGDSYTTPFYIEGIGAIWFLWATFWGCVMLKILDCVNEKLRAVIVICVFCVGYYSRNICWFPLSIQAGCTALLFLYFGFLIKKIDIKKINVSNEIKMFSYISALIVWIFFVKDFKSFWLVHCDVGRGPVDIFGSLCACYLLYVFSMVIEKKKLSRVLGYIGKNSILVLCVHNIEINLFPWFKVYQIMSQYGIDSHIQIICVACIKIVCDVVAMIILSKVRIIRRIYNIK